MISIYTAKLILNKKEYKGTLDFYVIKKIHEDAKEHGIKCAIQEVFKYISDMELLGTNEGQLILCSFLMHSVIRVEGMSEEEFANIFNSEKLEELEDIVNSFNNKFEYINKIYEKCMPKGEESEFDDEEVYISKKDEWNYPHMEYLWYSVLKRTDDFYRITPKTFFAQMEVHSEIHK